MNKEEKSDDKKKKNESCKTITHKISENPWILSTLIFGILFLLLTLNYFSGVNNISDNNIASSKSVGKNIIELVRIQFPEASLINISLENGIYQVFVSLNGKDVPIYVTRDGENLINGGITPLNIIKQQIESQVKLQEQQQNIPSNISNKQ